MEKIHRIWAEIDLDAIAHNMRIIRANTDKNAKVMAIVKADAYGHGVVAVAKTMLENGADVFGVACVDEAVQLRMAGFTVPILILGATMPHEAEAILDYDITTAAFDYDASAHLSSVAVKKGKKAKVHIKLDTGMCRIGIVAERSDAVSKIKKIALLDGIEVTGMFSHFSCADTEDEEHTFLQYKRFVNVADALEKEGMKIPVKHISNSAAIFRYKNMHLDMVRAGIVSYGLYPSDLIEDCGLIPAMSFKTAVARVETLNPGDKVSYGAIYVADKKIKSATLMVGYADGYSRLLSDKARAIINGEYVKIIGRICMDQCMADVTNVNNIAVGDVATLFGREGDKFIPVEEIADIMGTINYEIICMISKRVPRVYKKGGRYIDELNYISELSKK
ncbi:MAG: alanine racemase [Bacillota bacterium]|nr:alanine racemase [Bacillota bacterium]